MSGVFDLGVKDESVENKPDTPVEKTPAADKTAVADNSKTKTILLDGPLSNCYTQALNVVYGKEVQAVEHNVSQETSAIDTTIVMNLNKQNEINNKVEESGDEKLYVYATNTDNLEGEGLSTAFESVRLLIDNVVNGSKNSKLMVSIETLGRVSKNQVILEGYLLTNGVKIVNSRKAAMNFIQR